MEENWLPGAKQAGGWISDRATGFTGSVGSFASNAYHVWEADPFVGPNPQIPLQGAGRNYMPEWYAIFDDEAIQMGILVGLGIPGEGGWVKCSEGLTSLEFSDYAIWRMSSRGISELQVEKVVRGSHPFEYYHEGVMKTGYYDEISRIFVAQSHEGRIINAFKTDPNYIRNLRDKKP